MSYSPFFRSIDPVGLVPLLSGKLRSLRTKGLLFQISTYRSCVTAGVTQTVSAPFWAVFRSFTTEEDLVDGFLDLALILGIPYNNITPYNPLNI